MSLTSVEFGYRNLIKGETTRQNHPDGLEERDYFGFIEFVNKDYSMDKSFD
jgi:hypothetical protein